MKTIPPIETIYASPAVTVIRKKSGLGHHPKQNYQCALLRLNAQAGTRVCVTHDGIIEYLPNAQELRAMFDITFPELAEKLPPT